MTLGNQTIGTTLVATTATALGATFDTTVKSTVSPTTTPGNGQTFTLTTSTDVSGVLVGTAGTSGVEGNDTFNATDSTYTTNDVINGGNGTDVFNLTLAADNGQTGTVVGVETINVNASTFATATFNATGIVASGSTINVNNIQVGGATSFTLSNVGSGSTVVAGSGVTGTLTVVQVAASNVTVNAGSAAIATITGGTTGTTTVTGGSLLATASVTGAIINLTTTNASSSLTLIGTNALTDTATVSIGAAAGITNNATNVETVNLSTSFVATSTSTSTATFGTTAATTYNLTGSNSIILAGTAAMFGGKTVTDSTTAGTTTVKIATTGGSADLTKVTPDIIDVNATTASTYTVKNGQSIKLSADLAAVTIDSTELTTGSETLNLTLAASQTTETLTVSDFELINLTSNDGATATNTITVTQLTGSTASGSSIVVSGPDNLTVTAGATSFLNAEALTGALTATVHANQLKITGGTGSDTINAIDASFTVNGGSGSADTLAFAGTTDLSDNTVSIANIDILQIDSATEGAETVTLLSSAVTGNNWVVKGTPDGTPTNNDILQVTLDTTSVDLSKLVVDTASATVTIVNTNVNALGQSIIGSNAIDTLTSVGAGNITLSGGAGADLITTAGGADNISGDAGNDVIVTGAGVDTIKGGEGADSITAGLGVDVIDLTETTAATDTIEMTTGGVIAVDTVTGFKVGASNGDLLEVDLSDINALVADLSLAGAFVTNAAANTTTVVTIVSGAYDLGTTATSDIITISGDFTASTLEDALEIGGSRVLTGNGILSAGDAFLVGYDDGTDSYLAYVISTAGLADNGNFAAGDLTVTNLIKLAGVPDATTILTNNIDIIA